MVAVIIRPAAAHDAEVVAHLLEELGRDSVTPQSRPQFHATFTHNLARSDTAYLVAELDGLVAGFLSLEFRVRLNRSAPEAWIPDLIVTASARDHGCGKALLQAAFILARERGCRRVTLESGYSRTVAHHLYTSAGMQNEGYFFGRVLE